MKTMRTAGGLALTLTTALMLGGCSSAPTTPGEVTVAFYDAMRDRDYKQACEYVADRIIDQMDDGCEAQMEQVGEQRQVPDEVGVTERVNEDAGTAEVVVRSGEDQSTATLEEINGKWKLTNPG